LILDGLETTADVLKDLLNLILMDTLLLGQHEDGRCGDGSGRGRCRCRCGVWEGRLEFRARWCNRRERGELLGFGGARSWLFLLDHGRLRLAFRLLDADLILVEAAPDLLLVTLRADGDFRVCEPETL
jgi:hypothetical protein